MEKNKVPLNKSKSHDQRVLLIQIIYKYYMANIPSKTFVNDIYQDCPELEPKNVKVLEDCLANIQRMENLINNNMDKKWRFNRLNNVEKSILVMGTYELIIVKLSPKIVINEAIIIAKEYAAENAFKFINATLDAINKNQTFNQ